MRLMKLLLAPLIALILVASCAAPTSSPTPHEMEEREEEPSVPAPTESPTAILAEDEDLWWKRSEPTSSALISEALIPFIDAHSQVDEHVELEKVIQLMDKAGVALTILASRAAGGAVPPEEVISFASRHPGKIVPAVRTKSQELYSANDPRYYAFLRKQVNMPGFGAMAEVLMYYAPKADKTPLLVVYPDDERVQAALNYAIQKKWPFVVSIEFASAGALRDDFMTKFEALLVQNPKHPFVVNHMGQLDHIEVRRLIEAHPNIFFATSHANPRDRGAPSRSGHPWTNMFDSDRLSTYWKQVMIEHPDRFIFALDCVWAPDWSRYYLDQVDLWREAMKELPLEVAHAFAHGNAEHLWHLNLVK